MVKKICLQCRRPAQVQSWVRKIPWRREWLPTPVFLPGEFHGQRSLAGYSPWGCKESDSTEQITHIHTHTHTYTHCQNQNTLPISLISMVIPCLCQSLLFSSLLLNIFLILQEQKHSTHFFYE